MNIQILIASTAASIAILMPASAADYIYSPVLNVALLGPKDLNGYQVLPISSGPSFYISPGDTISGTVTFLPGQTITITDVGANSFEYISLAFYSSGYRGTSFTSSFTFLNPSVPVPTGFSSPLGNSVLTAALTSFTASSLSFEGFSYTIAINDLTDISNVTSPGNFQAANMQISADVVTVPEPSQAALVLTGLGMLFSGRRQRRSSL